MESDTPSNAANLIHREMVFHTSIHQGVSEEEAPKLWAKAAGNARGLNLAHRHLFEGYGEEEIKERIETAIETYHDDGTVVSSHDSKMAERLSLAFIEGLLRGWTLATDEGVSTTPEALKDPNKRGVTESLKCPPLQGFQEVRK